MDVSAVIGAIDGLLLERLSDGRFAAASRIPAWCHELRPAVDWREPFGVEEVFPFLAVFLPEAERAWASAQPARADSEIWGETHPTRDEELHFVATAVRADGARALLVLRSDTSFREHQSLLQRARELRMTYGALMREMEQKDVLVHAIVHDLAAPLHTVMGVLSMLDEHGHDPKEQEWIRAAMQAATRQRSLITEILDVMLASEGALGRRGGEPVDLSDCLGRVIEEREPVARRQGVRLDARRPESATWVVADSMRLFRVLTNLLDNALRHSPAGGEVRVVTKEEDDGILLAVEDDGPGVDVRVLPRLFEKFARARGTSGGTGLGLFFCRISVENWGGAIGYEQRPSGGARFWVRLRKAVGTDGEEAR